MLDTICDADCRKEATIVQYSNGELILTDPTQAALGAANSTVTINIHSIPGFLGAPTCSASSCKFYTLVAQDGLAGMYGAPPALLSYARSTGLMPLARHHKPKFALMGRTPSDHGPAHHAFDTQTTSVSFPSSGSVNPAVMCLIAGEGVLFDVSHAAEGSYPEYQKDNLLNSNLNFDWGYFRNLSTSIASNASSVSLFAFTFSTPGVYVFNDHAWPDQITIIRVVAKDQLCPTPGNDPLARIQPFLFEALIGNGVQRNTNIVMTPDWDLLGIMIALITCLIALVVIGLYSFQTHSWTSGDLIPPRYKQIALQDKLDVWNAFVSKGTLRTVDNVSHGLATLGGEASSDKQTVTSTHVKSVGLIDESGSGSVSGVGAAGAAGVASGGVRSGSGIDFDSWESGNLGSDPNDAYMNELTSSLDLEGFDFSSLYRLLDETKASVDGYFSAQEDGLRLFYERMSLEIDHLKNVLAVKMHVQLNKTGEGMSEAVDRLVSGELLARQAFQDLSRRRELDFTKSLEQLVTYIRNLSDDYHIFPIKDLLRLITDQIALCERSLAQERARRKVFAAHSEMIGRPIIDCLAKSDLAEEGIQDRYIGALKMFDSATKNLLSRMLHEEQSHAETMESFDESSTEKRQLELDRFHLTLCKITKEIQQQLSYLDESLTPIFEQLRELEDRTHHVWVHVQGELLEQRWSVLTHPSEGRIFRGINPELAKVLSGLLGMKGGMMVDPITGCFKPREPFDATDPFDTIFDHQLQQETREDESESESEWDEEDGMEGREGEGERERKAQRRAGMDSDEATHGADAARSRRTRIAESESESDASEDEGETYPASAHPASTTTMPPTTASFISEGVATSKKPSARTATIDRVRHVAGESATDIDGDVDVAGLTVSAVSSGVRHGVGGVGVDLDIISASGEHVRARAFADVERKRRLVEHDASLSDAERARRLSALDAELETLKNLFGVDASTLIQHFDRSQTSRADELRAEEEAIAALRADLAAKQSALMQLEEQQRVEEEELRRQLDREDAEANETMAVDMANIHSLIHQAVNMEGEAAGPGAGVEGMTRQQQQRTRLAHAGGDGSAEGDIEGGPGAGVDADAGVSGVMGSVSVGRESSALLSEYHCLIRDLHTSGASNEVIRERLSELHAAKRMEMREKRMEALKRKQEEDARRIREAEQQIQEKLSEQETEAKQMESIRQMLQASDKMNAAIEPGAAPIRKEDGDAHAHAHAHSTIGSDGSSGSSSSSSSVASRPVRRSRLQALSLHMSSVDIPADIVEDAGLAARASGQAFAITPNDDSMGSSQNAHSIELSPLPMDASDLNVVMSGEGEGEGESALESSVALEFERNRAAIERRYQRSALEREARNVVSEAFEYAKLELRQDLMLHNRLKARSLSTLDGSERPQTESELASLLASADADRASLESAQDLEKARQRQKLSQRLAEQKKRQEEKMSKKKALELRAEARRSEEANKANVKTREQAKIAQAAGKLDEQTRRKLGKKIIELVMGSRHGSEVEHRMRDHMEERMAFIADALERCTNEQENGGEINFQQIEAEAAAKFDHTHAADIAALLRQQRDEVREAYKQLFPDADFSTAEWQVAEGDEMSEYQRRRREIMSKSGSILAGSGSGSGGDGTSSGTGDDMGMDASALSRLSAAAAEKQREHESRLAMEQRELDRLQRELDGKEAARKAQRLALEEEKKRQELDLLHDLSNEQREEILSAHKLNLRNYERAIENEKAKQTNELERALDERRRKIAAIKAKRKAQQEKERMMEQQMKKKMKKKMLAKLQAESVGATSELWKLRAAAAAVTAAHHAHAQGSGSVGGMAGIVGAASLASMLSSSGALVGSSMDDELDAEDEAMMRARARARQQREEAESAEVKAKAEVIQRIQSIEQMVSTLQTESSTWRGEVFIDSKDAHDPTFQPSGTEPQLATVAELDAKSLVLYRFGIHLIDLLFAAGLAECPVNGTDPRSTHTPLQLLLASALPPNPHTHTAFINSCQFNAEKGILFMRKQRLNDVGEFILVLIHACAHITTQARKQRNDKENHTDTLNRAAQPNGSGNDGATHPSSSSLMWDDRHPDFIRHFHSCLQFLCADIFYTNAAKALQAAPHLISLTQDSTMHGMQIEGRTTSAEGDIYHRDGSASSAVASSSVGSSVLSVAIDSLLDFHPITAPAGVGMDRSMTMPTSMSMSMSMAMPLSGVGVSRVSDVSICLPVRWSEYSESRLLSRLGAYSSFADSFHLRHSLQQLESHQRAREHAREVNEARTFRQRSVRGAPPPTPKEDKAWQVDVNGDKANGNGEDNDNENGSSNIPGSGPIHPHPSYLNSVGELCDLEDSLNAQLTSIVDQLYHQTLTLQQCERDCRELKAKQAMAQGQAQTQGQTQGQGQTSPMSHVELETLNKFDASMSEHHALIHALTKEKDEIIYRIRNVQAALKQLEGLTNHDTQRDQPEA